MVQDIKIFISCHKEYYVPKHPGVSRELCKWYNLAIICA
jgi:hypothetical protein